MLEAWNRTAATFCAPVPGSHGTEGEGWLRCRVQVDDHLPPATAPHTMCDGANIVLDLERMAPSNCLPSRPGYMCDEPKIWHSYPPGALSANCTRTERFAPDQFPNDHLKDMFAGFQGLAEGAPGAAPPAAAAFGAAAGDVTGAAAFTLLVARERGEHANLFHASTDFLNIFLTLHAAGAVRGARGARAGLEDVQVRDAYHYYYYYYYILYI
jgi:hypothetical protein